MLQQTYSRAHMVDTCTHAHNACVCERVYGKLPHERGAEICCIYVIGFQIPSIHLKGVRARKKTVLAPRSKPTVSRVEDEINLQQFVIHLQSNKYLITSSRFHNPAARQAASQD